MPKQNTVLGLDDLTTYSVYQALQQSGEATFENIVAAAFQTFPDRFALRGYPQWPDSAVIAKSIWRCRTDKHFVVGSVKDGFRLTPRGQDVVSRVQHLLGSKQPRDDARMKQEKRTRAGRLLSALEDSAGYQIFKTTGSMEALTRADLTDMLLSLPDSPASAIKRNLAQFRDAAELYNREDLLGLLNQVERRLLAKSAARLAASPIDA